MKRENPAGTKIANAFLKAKSGAGYGAGLRRMFTRNNLARIANKRKSVALLKQMGVRV